MRINVCTRSAILTKIFSRAVLQARISRQDIPTLLLLLTDGRLSGSNITSTIRGLVSRQDISHKWCGRRQRLWDVGELIVTAKIVSAPILIIYMINIGIISGV
jgi:hypothetical protein